MHGQYPAATKSILLLDLTLISHGTNAKPPEKQHITIDQPKSHQ